MEQEVDRVVIQGTGGDFIALRRGTFSSGGYGIPAIIEIVASSLRAEVNAELWYLDKFHADLTRLYQSLSGEAGVGGEGEFAMTLRGNGHGGVSVVIEATLRDRPEVRVSVETTTDQTFLPHIAETVRRVFLIDPR